MSIINNRPNVLLMNAFCDVFQILMFSLYRVYNLVCFVFLYKLIIIVFLSIATCILKLLATLPCITGHLHFTASEISADEISASGKETSGWSTAYDTWVYVNCRLRAMETKMSTTRHAVDCKSLLTYNGDFTFLPPLVTTTELIDVSSRSQSLVCFVVYHLNLQFASH